MSALGQERTFPHVRLMSALPLKADIAEGDRHVHFVPKADSCTAAINDALRTGIAGFSRVTDVG
jgi:hypothetical protein